MSIGEFLRFNLRYAPLWEEEDDRIRVSEF